MKKIIAFLLSLLMLLSLFGCAAEEAKETLTTEASETKEETKKEEKETETAEEGTVYNHKADVTNIREKLEAIPKVNPSLTTDQLRQICVDYLQLSVSFQWIPDRTFSYSDSDVKKFYEGKLEGGIPYINVASGNLYRFLEFYDDETGVVDCDQIARYPDLFGTACSGTAGWAWSRVINSAQISWTSHMNVAHGFIPVGDYKYDTSIEIMWYSNPDGTRTYNYTAKDVCKQNGKQVMFESYAKTLLADCFSSGGHVRMLVEPINVVRNPEDGTIDGEKSTATLGDQGLYNTGDHHTRTTSDGTSYQIRGNDAKAYTFNELFEDGYLVHTFAEFLGTDPAESATASITHSEPTITATQLSKDELVANYPISDIFIKVNDANGNEKMNYKKRMARHYSKSTELSKVAPTAYLENFAKEGGCTIEISAQLSTGDLITVYQGDLIPS